MNKIKILTHRRSISLNSIPVSNKIYSNKLKVVKDKNEDSMQSRCRHNSCSNYIINIGNIEKTEDGKYIYKNENGGRDWKKTGDININTGFSFF
jgi:hypothetical protein